MTHSLVKFNLTELTKDLLETKEDLDKFPLAIAQQVMDCVCINENTDYRIIQGLQAVSDYQNNLITLDQLRIKKNAAAYAAQDEETQLAYMVAALTHAVYIHDYTLNYKQIQDSENEIDLNFNGYTADQALDSQKYATRAVYKHTNEVIKELGNTNLEKQIQKYLTDKR